MQKVPKLQATVRDTAGEVVNRLTEEYELPALNVDQEAYFDTRLIKFDTSPSTGDSEHVSTEWPRPGAAAKHRGFQKRRSVDGPLSHRSEIGRGAMGRVMLAEDEMVGEPVILKFMHPELTAEEASRERFLREVKYSRKVSHPNVIRIHDMLFKGNLSAISMEYFESRASTSTCARKSLRAVKKGLDILLQVANGMQPRRTPGRHPPRPETQQYPDGRRGSGQNSRFRHRVGVVQHRIDPDQNRIDYRHAGVFVAGTRQGPGSRSPQRYLCARHYRLRHVCGQLPHTGEPMSLLFQHLEGKAVPVHEIRPEVGARISLLVQKMMAVELEDRLQTMDDVAEAIKEVQEKERVKSGAMSIQSTIEQKLENEFDAAYLQVENESHMHNVAPGSESHFKVTIVSDSFQRPDADQASSQVNRALARGVAANPCAGVAYHDPRRMARARRHGCRLAANAAAAAKPVI